jgi:hypothetical protein
VNRSRRREIERRQAKVTAALNGVMDASTADGKPWHVYGMTGACSDCTATASMHGQGRNSPVMLQVNHDQSCPVARGTVTWQPVPI